MSYTTTQVDEAADEIRRRWRHSPKAGLVLGTGLGGFADAIESPIRIPYDQIPHFPRSTAIGHKGELVCGTIEGVSIVTMEGRFHLYEGYSVERITLPIHVMRRLGAEVLIVSNASGGMHHRLSPGDLVVIDDHINLMFANPLQCPAGDSSGYRPLKSSPYDAQLIERALRIGRRHGGALQRGVYLAVRGPNYETRAEYRFFRQIGGDVVGMSTVPEVLVAVHVGLRVLALSVVTNVALPDMLGVNDGAAVVEAAASAEPLMRAIVRGVLAEEASGAALGASSDHDRPPVHVASADSRP